jgi:phosphate-selective porin
MLKPLTLAAIAVVLTLTTLPRICSAQADNSEAARLKKLEDAVRLLQQRNTELEHEVHDLKASHQPFAPVISDSSKSNHGEYKSVTIEPSPPPVDVHPAGPEFKLSLGGYIQFNFEDGDVSAFEGRFGASALKDRFRLRRARITLIGDFLENFDFKIEGDFEQSDSAITALRSVNLKTGATTTVTNSNRVEFSGTDIFINWHQYPEFQIKIGQWKAPFGLEQLTSDTQIYTIERSLPTGALTPERQIGAMVWGKPFATIMPDEKDLLTYYAGAFNGNGRNFNNNDNNEFMYVGRLELQPWKSKFLGDSFLKLSGDYLYSRDQIGTNISPALNLRVASDGSLSAYTLTSPDERNAWSVDGWLRLGPFDLIAEYLSEDVDPRRTFYNVAPTFADFSPHGWYVQGSYFLLPKKLQAVVKWEELTPDQLSDDGIHSITAGLNYYIHGDNIKLMADYVHTWSDFRSAHPQFGDDQFDEVLLRMQVVF